MTSRFKPVVKLFILAQRKYFLNEPTSVTRSVSELKRTSQILGNFGLPSENITQCQDYILNKSKHTFEE
jgi:hypothetical protein